MALWKPPNGRRASIRSLVQGEAPHGAGWPMSLSPVIKPFNAPTSLHYHQYHLPSTPLFLLNGQQHVTWTTWGLKPEAPSCIYCPSTYWCVWGWGSGCVCVRACVCVLWKDEANNTERPGQVKWYCPQQSLYIATQTGPQDEYNVFWLNTETAQPCRQKESDCNRQDSSGAFIFIQPAN